MVQEKSDDGIDFIVSIVCQFANRKTSCARLVTAMDPNTILKHNLFFFNILLRAAAPNVSDGPSATVVKTLSRTGAAIESYKWKEERNSV